MSFRDPHPLRTGSGKARASVLVGLGGVRYGRSLRQRRSWSCALPSQLGWYRVRIATFTNLSFDTVLTLCHPHERVTMRTVRKRANPLVEPTVCVSPLVCRVLSIQSTHL